MRVSLDNIRPHERLIVRQNKNEEICHPVFLTHLSSDIVSDNSCPFQRKQDDTSNEEHIALNMIDDRISLLKISSRMNLFGICNQSIVPINPKTRWSGSDEIVRYRMGGYKIINRPPIRAGLSYF